MLFITGERRRLKKGAVPSIFIEREQPKTEQDVQKEEQKRQRQKRASQRAEKRQLEPNIENIGQELEAESEEPVIKARKTEDTHSSVGIQCSLLTEKSEAFTVVNFQHNDKAIKYYTGFDDYEQFMMFFHVLGPAAYHLNLPCATIQPKDQLFMTLIKGHFHVKLENVKSDIWTPIIVLILCLIQIEYYLLMRLTTSSLL